MATNRNFIVKQGLQVGGNATACSTWTSNSYVSNKNDVLSEALFVMDFSKGNINPRIQTYRPDGVAMASYVAANGKIVVVGNNTPRVTFSLDTGKCDGLLSEESRRNDCPYSDIEGPPGTLPLGMSFSGLDQVPTVSTDVWIGPNRQSAKHVRGTTPDNNVGYIGSFSGTGLTSTVAYTFSVYIYIPSNTTITTCSMQFESGTLTLNPNPTASANLSIRDRWQRLSGTAYITGGTGFATPVLRTNPLGATVYSDCWQIERGEYASSWIQTIGNTTRTRAEEQHTITIDPNLLSKEFTMYAEAAPFWTANALLSTANNAYGAQNAVRGVFALNSTAAPIGPGGFPIYYGYGLRLSSDATSAVAFGTRQVFSTLTPLQANSGTFTSVNISNAGYNFNSFQANTYFKIVAGSNTSSATVAIGYSNNSIANTLLGSSIYAANLEITPLDRIYLGWQYSGGNNPFQFGGAIKKFAVFPRLLSNTEMVALVEYT